jgi:adenine-specific DNA glycosylase
MASAVLAWQAQHGRSGLPWQGTSDPYRVWLSEIMLQQTQVVTVLDYYPRFLQRFPNVASLAAVEWLGLLHPCAQPAPLRAGRGAKFWWALSAYG